MIISCKKNMLFSKFANWGHYSLSRSLQFTPFQNPGRVVWAWQSPNGQTEILVSNIGLVFNQSFPLLPVSESRRGSRERDKVQRTKDKGRTEILISNKRFLDIAVSVFQRPNYTYMYEVWRSFKEHLNCKFMLREIAFYTNKRT